MNVISGSVGLSRYYGCVSPVYYMLYPRNKNTGSEIDEYYKCAVDYENKYFLDFDVQVVGFKMAFPREKTKDK